MMEIPFWQVDAFSSEVFAGNPAGVCLLNEWLTDDTLQNIAAENNLSETAFLVRGGSNYDIRWFTPVTEVDLCGHATLAGGHVIMGAIEKGRDHVDFMSKSGKLSVSRRNDLLLLDFPARPPVPCAPPVGMTAALGAMPSEVLSSRDLMAVFDDEKSVRDLAPDVDAIARLDCFSIVVTAPGEECDFVSRFFAPREGIPEDPVTGSAHCTLTPYWAKRLGRTKLHAFQLSRRGGELFCEDRGERISIGGRATTYLTGTVHI